MTEFNLINFRHSICFSGYSMSATITLSDAGPSPIGLVPDDIFIVEDEPVARRALLYLIQKKGFTASAYATAEDALVAVGHRGVPRVLLVDLHLPGMNGIEFIRRLERINQSIFPVLISAAAADELDRLRGRHPVVFFPKPLDFSRLVRLLEDRNKVN